MTTYAPDRWVIVEISDVAMGTTRKVLGSWYGGYAGSNSYRLSSGVSKVVDKGDYWEVHNRSGSIYICGKESNGMSMFTQSFLSSMISRYPYMKFTVLKGISNEISSN
jgi:hypothetical protein